MMMSECDDFFSGGLGSSKPLSSDHGKDANGGDKEGNDRGRTKARTKRVLR